MINLQDFAIKDLPGIYRLGYLSQGAIEGRTNGVSLPLESSNQWEENMENGFNGQWNRIFGGMDAWHNNQAGVNTTIEHVRRLLDGGVVGVAFDIWGTPSDLATVPLNQRGNRRRLVYAKYPPSDFEEWARRAVRYMHQFVRALGPEKLYFSIGTEPSRYYWRGDDAEFFRLYGITQDYVKRYQQKTGVEIKASIFQLSDLDNSQLGAEPWITTPTWEYLEWFLQLAKENDWQLAHLPLFSYLSSPSFKEETERARGLLDQYGYQNTFIVHNETQTSSALSYDGVFPYVRGAERDSEIGAAWTAAFVHNLNKQGLLHCDLDFLDEHEWMPRKPGTFQYIPRGYHRIMPFVGSHGLQTWPDRIKKPRYTVARFFNMLYNTEVVLDKDKWSDFTVPMIISVDDASENLRVMAWNYRNWFGTQHYQSYQEVRAGEIFPTSIKDVHNLFTGFELNRVAMINSQSNNAFGFIMPFTQRMFAQFDLKKSGKPDKRELVKVASKLDELVEYAKKKYDVIQWDASTQIGKDLNMDSFSVAMLEFKRK